MANDERRYEHSERAISARVLEETVILDIARDRYTRLNGSAGLLWEELAEPRTVAELADRLSERYGIPAERATADASALIERLRERRLIEIAEAGAKA